MSPHLVWGSLIFQKQVQTQDSTVADHCQPLKEQGLCVCTAGNVYVSGKYYGEPDRAGIFRPARLLTNKRGDNYAFFILAFATNPSLPM